MKKLLVSLSICSIAVLFGACKKSDSSPSNTASVAFVNGCTPQTTLSLDASVNGSSVSGATNLAFLSNSNYRTVTAGNSEVLSFSLSGLNTLFATTTQTLTANSSYTLFAGGIFTSPSYVFTTDDLSTPSSGNAKIRLVNLSADSISLTGNVGSTVFASDVTSLSASPFALVPAGTYAIKAGGSNLSTVVIAGTGSTQLNSGKIYTVIYTGTTAGTGSATLTATLLNNN